MSNFSFEDSLNLHAAAIQKLYDQEFINKIGELAEAIVVSIRGGGKLIVFGNGGSAAEATHFATELVSRCSKDHNPWPAISLTDSSSNLTAIGNDYGFEKVFSRQIEAIANEHDCIIAFSTSGKSPNVIKGLEIATKKTKNIYLVTGLNYIHDSINSWKYIAMPSNKTTVVQEMHLWLIHALSEYCESQLI